jgi:hypothetical protein
MARRSDLIDLITSGNRHPKFGAPFLPALFVALSWDI